MVESRQKQSWSTWRRIGERVSEAAEHGGVESPRRLGVRPLPGAVGFEFEWRLEAASEPGGVLRRRERFGRANKLGKSWLGGLRLTRLRLLLETESTGWALACVKFLTLGPQCVDGILGCC